MLLGEGKQRGRGLGVIGPLSEGIEGVFNQVRGAVERLGRAGGLGRDAALDLGLGGVKAVERAFV